jgi:hypothetical protein
MTAKRMATTAVALLMIGLVVGACGRSDQRAQVGEVMEADSDARSEATVSPTAEGVTARSASLVARSGGGSGGGGDDAAVADSLSTAQGAGIPNVLPSTLAQSKIVKTATIHVEVAEGRFARQFSEAATIASTYGGFVASSTSAAGDDDALDAGTLVIRVPAESFDKARNDLRKLGKVQREQLSGDDVGGQLADIEARLRNLRAQEEAIRALMAKAKDVNETLTVQNQLTTVRGQIEELVAQQARLNDSVAYSTVTLNLTEPGAKVDGPAPGGLAGAWQRAVDGAEAVLGGTIVALGYLLPLAVLVLAAALVARAVWRLRERAVPLPRSAGEDGA